MGKDSNWSLQSLIELGVSGLLVILGLVFLFLGVQDYRLRSASVAAFEAYDRNDPGKVEGFCRDALSVDEMYHPARQLLAKILLEQETPDLEAAEKEYRHLLDGGYSGTNAHVGLGVISLLRASREKDPAAASNWIKSARHSFQDAGGDCIEAQIGLAHAALLESLKNSESLSRGKGLFQKVLARLDSNESARASITRDGLVDLYAGLGRAACDPDAYQEEAATWIHTSHYYAPDWILPLVNLVYIDAQRYVTETFDRDSLKEERPSRLSLTRVVETMSANSPALKEAHLQRQLAIAYAFARVGDISEFQGRIRSLRTGLYRDRMEPLRVEAFGLIFLIGQEGLESTTLANYLTKAVEALDRLSKHPDLTDVSERGTVLNNQAVALYRLGVVIEAKNRIRQALNVLQEAIKLDPGNALFKKNLVSIESRVKK
jgi:tetratricopeptide (TPR) repeat protein